MKRLKMRKIRDAMRLEAAGLSTRKIAASLGVGQSTTSDYLSRARAAGLSWPLSADRDRPMKALWSSQTASVTLLWQRNAKA